MSTNLITPNSSPIKLYKSYIFDLDGTIYLGEKLLPGVAETISTLKAQHAHIVYLTNKPLQLPADYADKLSKLGIPTSAEEVISATDALLSYLQAYAPNVCIFVIGEPLLVDLLESSGHRISSDPDEIELVVVSFDRTFDYAKLQIAFDAVRKGARIVATNPDAYCPIPGGGLPDCAAMLAALEACTGSEAEAIVGKPSIHMANAVLERSGIASNDTILIGDRLATDIHMANTAGMSSALVLTGATTLEESKSSIYRPNFILNTLSELIPTQL